jgi:hypothetical protein
MSDKSMPLELDEEQLDHLPAKVLRMMIRKLRAKRLSDRDPKDTEKEQEEAESEREKLSKAHEDAKGAAPKVPVMEDDLPEELSESDDSSEEEAAEQKKPRK